jgi:hypothetical protein
MIRSRHLFLLAALSFLSTREALASDPGLAARLFNEGRVAVDHGDFETGCAKLTESQRLDPRVGTLGKLAECEEKRGRLTVARTRWQEAVTLARATNDQRRAAAEEQLARIDRALPKSVETPPPAEGPATASAPPAPAPPAPPIARAPAPAPSSSTLVEAPARAREENAPPSPSPQEHSSSSPLRTVGIVATGAGVAALAGGAIFLIEAVKLNADSNREGCVGTDCSASSAAADARRSAYGDGNIATGLFIGGGAVAAAGVAVWLFAPRRASPPERSLNVAPLVGAHGAGLVMGGVW